MISAKVLLFVVLLGVALAYNPGHYVPRSFYVIDPLGHQSEPVFIRNRRDIMNNPLFRAKRSDGYASASSHASASASSSAGGYIPNFASDPYGILEQIQNLLNSIPNSIPNNIPYGGSSGAGAYSHSSSVASGHGTGAGFGSGTGDSYGGLGYGHDAGQNTPTFLSRSGFAEGDTVNVESHSHGQKGASSSSQAVSDGQKVSYSFQASKY